MRVFQFKERRESRMEDDAEGNARPAVADMARALAFYRLVGLAAPADADDHRHAPIDVGGGAHLEFGDPSVIAMYDSGWRGHMSSTATALRFGLPSRDAVDVRYEKPTGAGCAGHLAPFDASRGSRDCEVDGADGHTVGLHSPRS